MHQEMLNVCYNVSNDLFISFNYSISHCIMIGPKTIYRSELDAELQWFGLERQAYKSRNNCYDKPIIPCMSSFI